MRIEVGMKECSKKKLVTSTWAGYVEKREIESGGEMESRKTKNAMED